MRTASSMWLAGIALFAGILIAISVLLNVLADSRDDELLPDDSPEGVVQRYLRAISDSEIPTAYGYLSNDLKSTCTIEHLQRSRLSSDSSEFSASLATKSELGEEVLITVEISEFEFDRPFGGTGRSFPVTITLAEIEDTWLITEPPWPIGWCPAQPGKEPQALLPAVGAGVSAGLGRSAGSGGNTRWNLSAAWFH